MASAAAAVLQLNRSPGPLQQPPMVRTKLLTWFAYSMMDSICIIIDVTFASMQPQHRLFPSVYLAVSGYLS